MLLFTSCQKEEESLEKTNAIDQFYTVSSDDIELIESEIQILEKQGLLPIPSNEELTEFENYLLSDQYLKDFPIEEIENKVLKSNLCDRNSILKSLMSPTNCLSSLDLWRGNWIRVNWDDNNNGEVTMNEFVNHNSPGLGNALSQISPFTPTNAFNSADLSYARSILRGDWYCGAGYVCP